MNKFNINKFLITICLLMIGKVAFSQDFVYDWVRSAGGKQWDLANDIVIDGEKNVYMTGGFEQTAFFGSDSVTSAGDRDIFIAKYDSLGTLVWLKRAGGKKYDNVTDIKIDCENNLLITGNFQDTAYFENQKLITNRFMNDFIAKYAPDGSLIQVKHINVDSRADDLILTLAGNKGFFLSGTYYNSMSIDTDTIFAAGNTDMFVARFNNDFSSNSLINISGFAENILKDIKYFDRHLYISCMFTDSIDINQTRYFSYGSSDVLILKTDTAGNIIKVKHIAGFGKDIAGSLIIDTDSSLYLNVEFESKLYIDNDSLISKGGKDLLLLKIDNDFNTLWYRQIGSTTDEFANSLLINTEDAVYLTGSFSDTLKIDNKTIISKDGTADIFIAKYTPEGENFGLKQAGGSGNEYSTVIVNDPDNYLYIIGNFACDFAFETDSISSDSVFAANNDDIFLARFYDCDYAQYPDVGTDTSFCEHGKIRIRNTAQFQNNSSGNNTQYNWNNGQTGKQINVFKPGYYYVTTTDRHKCRVTSDSLYIEIHPLPEPDLGADIWANRNETLELFGGYFDNYIWSNGITDEKLILNTDTLKQTNHISLQAVNEFGCKGTDDIIVFVDKDLNKFNPDDNKTLVQTSSLVFPNPNTGQFYIKLNHINEPVKKITVYAFDGRVVYEQTMFNKDIPKITLKTKGAHFMIIETKTKKFFEKIIIN